MNLKQVGIPRVGIIGINPSLYPESGLIDYGVAVVIDPGALGVVPSRPVWAIPVAGLCVGLGTRLANGCTSGHGVVGIARLSPRSFVATGTFMSTGALVVFIMGGA